MARFDKKELTSKEAEIFVSEIPVRFQDVDAAGIVFFARFFEYVHQAYEEFLAKAGQPLPEVLATRAWAAPLMHVEADYFMPLVYGDVVRVRMVAALADESVIHLGWCLEKKPKPEKADSASRSRVCAAIQTSHAFVSLPEFARIPVPKSVVHELGLIGSAGLEGD